MMDLLAGSGGATATIEIHPNVVGTVDWNSDPSGGHSFLATVSISGAQWIPMKPPGVEGDRSVRGLQFGPQRFERAADAIDAVEGWLVEYCGERGCTHPLLER